MALSPDQLSAQLKSLKRGPAPKAPGPSSPTSPVAGMGAIDLQSIKLRKTGMRQSLIESDIDLGKENTSNELNNVFAARRKMFEQGSEKPATMPRPARPRKFSEEETQKPRSDSLPGSMTDSNENIVNKGGTPKLRPLPTLQSIGLKPPQKPAKPLILTMKIEKKYKNHKVMIAPKVKTAIVEEVLKGSFDEDVDIVEDGEDIYDDINTGASVPETPSIPAYKPAPPQPVEPELIEEDTYDDVEQLAEVVKSQLGQTQANQTIGGLSIDNADGEFGEDFYQPVEGTFSFERTNDIEPVDVEDEEPPEASTPTPPSRESKEDIKAKKEREKKEKELQKKKERDEQRRKKEDERREREEKKRKEDERKRREKTDRDIKKAHKLKGNEPTVCKGSVKEDYPGTGNKELPCTKGSVLEVVAKDNCPNGKWLVRDQQGHFGYVPSEILLLEANPEENISDDANLDEDLYECVDTFQSKSSAPNDFTEDFYDDTVAPGDDDFYEDLPCES